MYAPNYYPSGRKSYCCDVRGIASAVSTLRSRQTLHRVRRSVSRKCFFFFFFSVRVDHSAPISPSIVAALVQTDGRLVCHTLQPPPRREHVPRSGPGSVEGGLSVILFVKPFELCLPPPLFTSAEGVLEGRVGSGHDDPRRFQVARPTVVPKSPRPHARPSSQTAHRAENSHSVTQRLSRRESTRSRSSRVTSAQGLLLAPGASQENVSLSQGLSQARYPVHLCSVAYMVWEGS